MAERQIIAFVGRLRARVKYLKLSAVKLGKDGKERTIREMVARALEEVADAVSEEFE